MRAKAFGVWFVVAAALLAAAATARAVETRVMVRVRTKDAKFLGTSMGGARVVIRRADSGEVLATGLTSGGTGDTKRIITDPHVRGRRLTDNATAGFEATLDLGEPTFVTVEVSGPMGRPRSVATATVQTWLIPGRHVAGDGLVVEIPGFAVAIASPGPDATVALAGGKAKVPIAATVVMM